MSHVDRLGIGHCSDFRRSDRSTRGARGAPDRRCAYAPAVLRGKGLEQRIAASGRTLRWTAAPPVGDEAAPPLATVATQCAAIARVVRMATAEDRFPLVIGGDHSCAVGTWSGMASAHRAQGALGLVWIDAHMDAHVPATSPSGNLHGMPLACLLGHGPAALTRLAGHAPAVAPQNVVLVGVRSFEAAESELLARLGVRIFAMAEILARGLDRVIDEAVAIASRRTIGFGVSIDVDVVDPAEASAVATPVAGGLTAASLIAALRDLRERPGYAAAEIVEYNPALDAHGATAATVCDLIAAVIPSGGRP